MAFTLNIINWYLQNKRDMPWRETTDPYKIWVSEIILQQTRINQGMAYYLRFIEKFPDIESLARAEEQDVLKIWQGLGYYTRARNYTAAAIASISFKLPYAVVDGNVQRVVARIFGITDAVDSGKGQSLIKKILDDLIDRKNPDLFNQAIMEFGALCCKPRLPGCSNCIFRLQCFAFQHDKIDELPNKKSVIRIKKRYFNYLVFKWYDDGICFTFLHKREEKDIWRNLFQFPLIEYPNPVSLKKFKESNELNQFLANDLKPKIIQTKLYRHQLTHREILTRFYIMKLDELPDVLSDSKYCMVKISDLDAYPVSRLIEQFLNDYQDVLR